MPTTATNRLVTISLLGLLSACDPSPTVAPPPVPTPEPTPPEPAPEPTPATPPGPASTDRPISTNPPAQPPPERRNPTYQDLGAVLNPSHSDGRRIYASSSGKCYVHRPFPEGQRPPPGTPQPQESVTCPPEMAGDAAWKACSGGALHLPKEQGLIGECICFQSGNPPPPPRWVTCPTSAKKEPAG